MNINATLFAQVVVFFMLAWFTMKFVWPPLIKALDERSRKIADGLEAAERGQKTLAAAKLEGKEALQQAHSAGLEKIAAAEKQAQNVADDIVAKARDEAAQIISQAQAEALNQMNQARNELRQEVALLAVKGAEQILSKEINPDIHSGLLSKLKAEL